MINLKIRSGPFRFPYRITAFVRAGTPCGALWLLVALLVVAPPTQQSSVAASELTIHLLDLDTAPTVGKPLRLRARLDDPKGAVSGLRFIVNGHTSAKIVASKGVTDYSDATTPDRGGPMAIVVEALDDGDRILARDVVWVKASSPYKEKVEVHGAPVWGDLIPRESLLHQHPVVSVHSYASAAERSPDDRFGQNRRPVRVVFLVDGKGFGERLPSILETLGAIGDPDGVILRARDEVGLLVIGDAPEARRDFRDGSLGRALARLGGMGGARPGDIDLGLLLRAIVNASSPEVSTVGIIVTNGVYWGTLFQHKKLPGENEGEYLLTLDDIQDIRAHAWEKDISFSTIAVSTPELPLEMDANGKLSFESLERKVNQALSMDAGDQGRASAARAATFGLYIRQMFDLLATLSASTGAEHGLRLATEKPESLREQAADILQPVVGRFQRRDFEVFEAAPWAKCPEAGQAQILERVSARSRDKLLLAIAVDRSDSIDLIRAAHDIQVALRGILKSLRPQDCLLVYGFSALDAERVSNCVDSEETIDLVSGQIIGGSEISQGTDIFGSAFTVATNMKTLEAYAGEKGGGPLDPGQKVDKAIVLLTDGWQTTNTCEQEGRVVRTDPAQAPCSVYMDAVAAVSFLKKSRVRVFEVLIESRYKPSINARAGAKQVAGWSIDTGGALLPPDGVALKQGKADTVVPQLISSVYWGMRDVYQIDYTSSSPEKEWRDVCVRIKNRPDLQVLREGGDGYRADKSAYAHLFRLVDDATLPLARRRQALETTALLGTEFEFHRVSSYVEGDTPELRVPALVGAIGMATRLGLPEEHLEKLYAALDAPARQTTITALVGRDDGTDVFLERILLAELRRPPDRTTEQIRFDALVALGRISGGLSNETLRVLGTLVQARTTPPELREAAHKLLETANARTPSGSD